MSERGTEVAVQAEEVATLAHSAQVRDWPRDHASVPVPHPIFTTPPVRLLTTPQRPAERQRRRPLQVCQMDWNMTASTLVTSTDDRRVGLW